MRSPVTVAPFPGRAIRPAPAFRALLMIASAFALASLASPRPARAELLFAPRVDYPTRGYTQHAHLIDLTGDGLPDLVVVNGRDDLVSVVPGIGSGGFGAPLTTAVKRAPYDLAVADFDGDGRLDVLLGYGNPTFELTLLPGDGTGRFGSPSSSPEAAGFTGIATGDMNGDGIPDAVVIRGSLKDTVEVRLVATGGVLQPATSFKTGVWPMGIALADLNADGRLDAVTTGPGSSNVSVLLGDGTGGLASHLDFPLNDAPFPAAVGDLNGDGRPDVVVPCASHRVSVFLAGADGHLLPRVDYATGKGFAKAAAIGDLNHDGLPDVVTVSDTARVVSVLFGDGMGHLAAHQDFTAPYACSDVWIADLDRDGFNDLVVLSSLCGTASVLLNRWRPDPPAGFTASAGPAAAQVTLAWAAAPFDSVVIERRASAGGGQPFARITCVAGGQVSFTDNPGTGVPWVYRLCGYRWGRVSAYSSEATAEPYGSPARTPSAFRLGSAGDGRTLRAHVSPPGGVTGPTTSWAGVTAVEIQQAADDVFAQLVDDRVVDAPAGVQAPGEWTTDLSNGAPGVPSWCRARLRDWTGTWSAWSAADSATPRRSPIVFVHGLGGHPTDLHATWISALAGAGFTRVDGPVLTPPLGPWSAWARQLRDFVEQQLDPVSGAWRTDENVMILAHDIGGLAARHYVELLGGETCVRALVMLGTPNHGAGALDLLLGPASVLPGVTARSQSDSIRAELDPMSFDLLRLNAGWAGPTDAPCGVTLLESALSGRTLPAYITVAGTAWAPCETRQDYLGGHADYCAVRIAMHAGAQCTSDGVVPVASAQLRVLPADDNLVDVDLPGCGRLAHDDRTASRIRALDADLGLPGAEAVTSMLDSPVLAQVIALRLGSILAGALRPESPATGMPSRICEGCDGSDVGDVATRLLAISSTSGVVQPGEQARHGVTVLAPAGFVVVASSADGPLALTLEGPGGVVIAPADTSASPGVRYESEPLLGYVAFDVAEPPPGVWHAVVSAPGAGDSRSYTVEWVARTPVAPMGFTFQPFVATPGDSLFVITAFPTGETLTATVTTPAGVTVALPWTAGPANSPPTARYGVPAIDGRYRLSVRAGPTDAPSRMMDTSFVVLNRPALILRSARLSWQPALPVPGQPVMLRCVVENTFYSTSSASPARVWVVDDATGEHIGEADVVVARHDSAVVNIPWIPAACGLHALTWRVGTVDVQPEMITTLSSAHATVPVIGPPAFVGAAAAQPSRFALGPPRPNPSRGAVSLDFDLPRAARVRLDVFDVQGRWVCALVSAPLPAGRHSRTWDGRDRQGGLAGSGLYFVRLVTPAGVATRRAVLIR